ncbi:MAG: PilZ domain-containing protein [Dissulfurispiraceae bacterium]
MDQATLCNKRQTYRVNTPALIACLPLSTSGDGDDLLTDHLRRVRQRLFDVNLSIGGIAFPDRFGWGYNCGDLIQIYIKPLSGPPVTAVAQVVRRDNADDGVATVAAKFLQLSPEAERKLSSAILNCQRKQ